MNDIEHCLFDTQGYIVVPDVLTHVEVARLLQAIPRREDGTVADRRDPDDTRMIGYPDPLFRERIHHPRLLPYLIAILGNRGDVKMQADPSFFLSHASIMSMRTGDHGPWFHNGGVPHDPWSAYAVHADMIFLGFTAVLWALSEVAAGVGGFWCIPGSHKANVPLPKAIETYAVTPSCVAQPAVRAGSLIIFSEALTHGTRPWTAEHERVALFYKYATPHVGWKIRGTPSGLALHPRPCHS